MSDAPAEPTHPVDVSKHFQGIHQTPEEYWRNHIKYWERQAELYDNILIVRYEDLLNDLQGSLSRIADFLGEDVKEFEDIETRVGWFNKNEKWSKDEKRQESSTAVEV